MMLILPFLLIVALLLWISTGLGAFFYGKRLGIQTQIAQQNTALQQAMQQHDTIHTTVAAAGTHAITSVATAVTHNRIATDESARHIRIIRVPTDCSVIADDIVHELRLARDTANSALRSGLRPAPPAASAADSK
ncbi:hypothetical protein MRX58_08595 [Xylella fastidiosa subsp. pauca]|uniref:hypothetical protein n=1 Tax=Xylella fastidiosa TaxID=2371 RepID=UPI001ADFD2C8|nr:hypothetical protein [Xylella fastidiosa]MDG5823598.1 hypothetical protein [Xylella fastidiosa subsp. pauca]